MMFPIPNFDYNRNRIGTLFWHLIGLWIQFSQALSGVFPDKEAKLSAIRLQLKAAEEKLKIQSTLKIFKVGPDEHRIDFSFDGLGMIWFHFKNGEVSYEVSDMNQEPLENLARDLVRSGFIYGIMNLPKQLGGTTRPDGAKNSHYPVESVRFTEESPVHRYNSEDFLTVKFTDES